MIARTIGQRRQAVEQYAAARTQRERQQVASRWGTNGVALSTWKQLHGFNVEIPRLPASRHANDQDWDDTEEQAELMRALIRAAGHGLGEWPAEVGDELVDCGRAKVVRGRLYIACVVPGVVVRGSL